MSDPKTERPELPSPESFAASIATWRSGQGAPAAWCGPSPQEFRQLDLVRLLDYDALLEAYRSEIALRRQAELACGLACEYHGCGARECTASRYQKLAQDMIAEVQRLRAALAAPPALPGLRAALEAVKGERLECHDRMVAIGASDDHEFPDEGYSEGIKDAEQAIQRLIDAER